MHEEIKQQLTSTYMRGFRAAVSGESLLEDRSLPPDKALGRGYREGQVVLEMGKRAAERYAMRVIDSPAMAQAQANAESGKVSS